ncbi:MAG TPA: hypothetical protein VGD80_26265 [Kofleriaceae bacterium]
MTDRSRRSTQTGTGVKPAGSPPAARAATPAPAAPGAHTDPFESAVTDVTPRPVLHAVEVPTPTQVEPATPTEVTARAERSEPIRVFSMKDATEAPRQTDERRAMQVQLRSFAEARRHETPVGLGHLAPPRDPRKARTRRLVDNLMWGCIAIMLACGIMLAIWLIAGR